MESESWCVRRRAVTSSPLRGNTAQTIPGSLAVVVVRAGVVVGAKGVVPEIVL